MSPKLRSHMGEFPMNAFRKFISIPLGIIVACIFIYVGIFDPPQTIRIPVIFAWLPDLIGFSGFFVLIGCLLGIIVWAVIRPADK